MTELAFSDVWYWFVLGAIVSYFIGCFNFAVLISRIKKTDIRGIGSGNPGTMNMSRTFGIKIGAINYFSDVFKGAIPVFIGYIVFRGFVFAGTDIIVSDFARYFFGAFAIIGHIFPVTMGFKGGKGIASTMGLFWCALSCETWWFVFIAFFLLLGVLFYIAFFEWGSMGSLIGVSSLTIWQGVIFVSRYSQNLGNIWVMAIFALLLTLNLLTWIAHYKNLYALMGGEEHRTSVKKMLKKKKA